MGVKYRRLRGLSGPQRRAIELEAEGRTSFEIAAAIGVSPGTVRNWRSGDLLYRAEANRRINEGIALRMARVEHLDHLSLGLIRGALEGGDVATALKFHALHARRSFKEAVEDPAMLRRQTARQKLFDDIRRQDSGSPDLDSALAPYIEKVESESMRWESEAFDALKRVREIEQLFALGDVPADEFIQAATAIINSLSVVMHLSEGEGPRALAPAPTAWQRQLLPEIHVMVHGVLDAADAGPADPGRGAPDYDVLEHARRVAETLAIVLLALVGQEQSPKSDHPFDDALEDAAKATRALATELGRLTAAGLVTDEDVGSLMYAEFDALKAAVMIPITAITVDTLEDPKHAGEQFQAEHPVAVGTVDEPAAERAPSTTREAETDADRVTNTKATGEANQNDADGVAAEGKPEEPRKPDPGPLPKRRRGKGS